MTEKEWLLEFKDRLITSFLDYGGTQAELARDAGVSESILSYYMNGQRVPGVRTILNLSYALNVELSYLVDFGEPIDR